MSLFVSFTVFEMLTHLKIITVVPFKSTIIKRLFTCIYSESLQSLGKVAQVHFQCFVKGCPNVQHILLIVGLNVLGTNYQLLISVLGTNLQIYLMIVRL